MEEFFLLLAKEGGTFALGAMVAWVFWKVSMQQIASSERRMDFIMEKHEAESVRNHSAFNHAIDKYDKDVNEIKEAIRSVGYEEVAGHENRYHKV